MVFIWHRLDRWYLPNPIYNHGSNHTDDHPDHYHRRPIGGVSILPSKPGKPSADRQNQHEADCQSPIPSLPVFPKPENLCSHPLHLFPSQFEMAPDGAHAYTTLNSHDAVA
jgi:hypothetical protein